MKKHSLKLLSLTFIIILSASCQDNEVIKDDTVSEMQIDLSGMKISLDLGSINNQSELDKSFKLLSEEAESMKEENKNIGFINYNLELQGENIYLIGIAIYNKDGKLVKSESKNNNIRSPGTITAACPEGYEELGACSNFSGTEDCIADKVGNYYRDNLNSIGDCAQTRVSVGVTRTTVCGKTC